MKSFRKVPLLAVISLAALLTVGVGAASAHGGPGQGPGARGIGISPLVTQSAKELGVTRAELKEAIVDSAISVSTRRSRTRTSTPMRPTSSKRRRATTCASPTD